MIDEKLIDKFLRGECSEEELKRLQQYWDREDPTVVEGMLKDNWLSAQQEAAEEDANLKTRLWRGIVDARDSTTNGHLGARRRRMLKWAAAAAITLLIGVGLYQIFLPEAHTEPGWVEQANDDRASMKIALEDGSAVWLKRHSKLIYPRSFRGPKRQVELLGEGYFDIAKDPKRPFIVQTGQLRTRVLGTAFNLKALKADSVVQVALVEGSVEVQWTMQQGAAVQIQPGEQLTYHRQKKQVDKERFLADAPYAWKNGVIYFVKADVWEVARTLEQWYDTEFIIKGDSAITSKIVHRFDTNKLSLDEVLKGISTVMDYRFEKQSDGHVLILPKH